MKTLRKIMLVCMCLLLPASGAWAVSSLSLDAPASAAIGQTFTVNVKVDTTAQLAGAAFTVAYDTSIMELVSTDDKITSSFFDLFADQFVGMPCEDTVGGCPSETSDGVDQPLVSNTVTTTTDTEKFPLGTRLAAARVQPEASPTSETVIVSLKLKFIKDAAVAGESYGISIKPTYLNNVSAGYDPADGKDGYIPLLVGYDDGATDEFPKLLESANGAVVSTVNILVDSVMPGDVDNSGAIDGLDLSYLKWYLGLKITRAQLDNLGGNPDVDCSGAIDGLDLSYLKWYLGLKLTTEQWAARCGK